MLLSAGLDDQRCRPRLVDAGRLRDRVVVAGLAGHLAGQQVARRLELHQADVGLEQRGMHPLAPARALALDQRRQDAVARA